MENIVKIFDSVGIDFDTFWKAALILLLGTLLINLFSRFVFGKRSVLNNSASSSIGILFIYAATIVLKSIDTPLSRFNTPLPLVTITESSVELFNFFDAHYTVICNQVLSLIILAFLVNLLDGWLPVGKNLFTWLFFRCVTVAGGYAAHYIVTGLLTTYLPNVIATYAPVILLVLLILLLLTGALKILVGALLTTVNPIIGGLYTFFFANIIGKQVTKAVLTSGILCAIVIGLHYAGITIISIASAALSIYIPLMIAVVILWYLVVKFL